MTVEEVRTILRNTIGNGWSDGHDIKKDFYKAKDALGKNFIDFNKSDDIYVGLWAVKFTVNTDIGIIDFYYDFSRACVTHEKVIKPVKSSPCKLYLMTYSGEVAIAKTHTCHYVYADGELEDLAGYDCVQYDACDTFNYYEDREEKVIAVLPDGKEVPAILIFWHSKPKDEAAKEAMRLDPVYGCHGRLVLESDIEAIARSRRLRNTPL